MTVGFIDVRRGAAMSDHTEERRAHVLLRRYWSALNNAGVSPDLAAIDMADPALPEAQLFLLEVSTDPYQSVFVFGGAPLQAFAGLEPAGRRLVVLLPEGVRADLCGACAMAVSDDRPVEAHGCSVDQEGSEVLYRTAFFPIRGCGGGAERYVIGTFGARYC